MKAIHPLKSILLRTTAIAVLAGGLSTSAFGVNLGDSGTGTTWYGSWQSGSGGEFSFQYNGAPLSNAGYASSTSNQGVTSSFQSFCLELGEYLYNNNAVSYVVNDEAVGGGGNTGTPGNQGGDRLSVGTSLLYALFASGNLPSYDYANSTIPGRLASAALLQNAIWALEEETTPDPLGNFYFDAVSTVFGGVAGARANAPVGGIFGVYALNIYNTDATAGQDLLYYTTGSPTTFNTVPDGGSTLALLGLGLAGFSVFTKSRRKA